MKCIIPAVIFFCCLFFNPASGQYNSPQNKVWAMGNGCGLDFSGNAPVPFNTSLKSLEGCASVCNDTGRLLFYTNGSEVWNASGSFMPHGQDITGTGMASTISATQGALIVPDGKRCGIYYIFSLSASSSHALYCSRVNMNLANGTGDVDTTFSLWRSQLKSGLSEKMVAIKSKENGSTWILVHHASEPEFYAYPLIATGPDTVPVTSVAGNAADYVFGTMKVNPVKDEIAVCNQVAGSGVALYNFNGASGQITFSRMIDSTCAAYGGTFSPDGNSFYLRDNGGSVVQYDLNLAYPAPARTVLGQNKLTDMKIAPNGKIYFISAAGLEDNNYYLGSIESPNSTGSACQYRDSVPGLFFPQITTSIARLALGLPNEVVGSGALVSDNETVYDKKYCTFPASGVVFQAETGYSNYLWDNGATGLTRSVNQSGTYWVKYDTYCGAHTDTFKVAAAGLPALTISYSNGWLSVANSYSDYQWYHDGAPIPGANSYSTHVSSTGWYSVAVQKDNVCADSAAYQVTEVTGIDSRANKNTIRIFPNPTHDRIYINSATAVNYCLYSIDGKVMAAGNDNMIDVTKLEPGLYILKLSDKAGRYLAVQKIGIE